MCLGLSLDTFRWLLSCAGGHDTEITAEWQVELRPDKAPEGPEPAKAPPGLAGHSVLR